MTLPAVELLRRFATHIVPPRFTRIRYYGFLANRVRAASLEKARELLGSPRLPRPPAIRWAQLCPRCHQGTMLRVARLDPQRPRTWFDSS